MSEKMQYTLDNPFIDGKPIEVTIEYTGVNFTYGPKDQVNVTFTMGDESFVVSELCCAPMDAWDSLETVAAALSFAQERVEQETYGVEPDELIDIDIPGGFYLVLESLPAQGNELEEYLLETEAV